MLVSRAQKFVVNKATESLVESRVLALILIHVPLGYLIHQSRMLATAHAAAVFFYGLYRAAIGNSTTEIACIASYIAGAEVLWRMSSASIPHESGKYALIAILMVYSARFYKGRVIWPVIFFALLMPAIIPTFVALDFSLARQYVSFNLSGPLSLAVCAWFFTGQVISKEDIGKVGIYFIAPAVSIATVTLFSTYTSDNISFRTSSNFVTSGGFGPNQVSATLALAFVMTFFVLFFWSAKRRVLLAGLVLLLPIFLVQSAMTFSRTGIYLALGSVLAGSLYLIKGRRARLFLAGSTIALTVVANVFILPALNSFTSGMLAARFQELDTTHRTKIIQYELETWEQNPLFGVGLGMARFYRDKFEDTPAHTEYSRLLAEHGLLGMAALCMLLYVLGRNVFAKRKLGALNMAFSLALTVYFIGFLFASGMRLVIPSVVLGLSFVTVASLRHVHEKKAT